MSYRALTVTVYNNTECMPIIIKFGESEIFVRSNGGVSMAIGITDAFELIIGDHRPLTKTHIMQLRHETNITFHTSLITFIFGSAGDICITVSDYGAKTS